MGGRGFGGIACFSRVGFNHQVKIIKIDDHKQYMWLQVDSRQGLVFIAACYFAPPQSPIYNNPNLSSADPFLHLGRDICAFQDKGDIILVGDFNARTNSIQVHGFGERRNPLWLNMCDEEEDEGGMWIRRSQDTAEVTQMGKHLLDLCGCFDLRIYNGISRFQKSSMFTCHTKQGKSVVDYFIAQTKVTSKLTDFYVGHKLPESPHNPLYFSLEGCLTGCRDLQQQTVKPRLQLDYRKAHIYEEMLEAALQEASWPTDCSGLHDNLAAILTQTAENVFTKTKGRAKGMPCNSWFDVECKRARMEWLKAQEDTKSLKEKQYKALTRKKKREFIKKRQEEHFKKLQFQPKLFWRALNSSKKSEIGVQWDDLVSHVRELYEVDIPSDLTLESQPTSAQDLFSPKDINNGIKSLANGKAKDSQGLMAELIKWGGDTLFNILGEIMNKAVKEGFPPIWQTNTIFPIFKGGKVEDARNYRTIMVSSLMAKLYGRLLEQKISKWAEEEGVRAPSQAGFRPHYSTIDHLITLKTVAEGAKGKGKQVYCCFVDFKKAFDTIPRQKLWDRMIKLKVPIELRNATKRLYEKVLAELAKPFDQQKASFVSKIGVKQGCPLSPTLFGLFIDELEDWIRQQGGGGVHIAGYVLLLLIYADDVVLLAKSQPHLQRHLHILSNFCSSTGMQVNIQKTKVLVIGKRDKSVNITYEGKKIEVVSTYKYLGLDFEDNYRWNLCVERRIQGGLKALFALQNKCRKSNIWSWSLRKFLFYTLVQPVVLYGCQVWGVNLAKGMWKKIEKVQKRFLIEELGVKVQTPYPILLAETGMLPLEGEALCLLISYVMKVKKMDSQRIPHKVLEATKEKGWYKEAIDWLQNWGISAEDLPETKAGIRDLVRERVIEVLWKDSQGKMAFYKEEINPMLTYNEQQYLKDNISKRKRQLICRLRVSSHDLEIETGRWRDTPRHERLCKVCKAKEIEDERHFIWQCKEYESIRASHGMHDWTPRDLISFFSRPSKQVGSILSELLQHRGTLLDGAPDQAF